MNNKFLEKVRVKAIHKLGGVMMAETAFSNPPYVVKQYEKAPVKLRAHSFVDDKTPDGVRDWIIRRLVEKIADKNTHKK